MVDCSDLVEARGKKGDDQANSRHINSGCFGIEPKDFPTRFALDYGQGDGFVSSSKIKES